MTFSRFPPRVFLLLLLLLDTYRELNRADVLEFREILLSCFSRNSNVSGERSPFEGSCCSGQGVGADSTESEEMEEVSKYRVVLLGDSGVGKTALVSQFMTSEYINTYDASLGKL